MDYEVVAVEWASTPGGRILKVIIDRTGGITVGNCAQVSREVGAVLDAEDWGVENYRLEVSSPGLNRPLNRLQDFERFAGQKAKITTKEPIAGRRHYKGFLKGIEGDQISIDVVGTEYTVPFEMVQKAQLVFEKPAKG